MWGEFQGRKRVSNSKIEGSSSTYAIVAISYTSLSANGMGGGQLKLPKSRESWLVWYPMLQYPEKREKRREENKSHIISGVCAAYKVPRIAGILTR